jgi:uncharacterized membrane protein YbhN (UPF0104 family)
VSISAYFLSKIPFFYLEFILLVNPLSVLGRYLGKYLIYTWGDPKANYYDFYSLLGIFMSFISFYFIGLSLKINISFLSYMFIIPITWTISNIPITLGGFGVRESTLVLLLVEFGVTSGSALTFSLIVLIINILLAISGGIIYILRNSIYKHKKDT